MGTVPYDHNKTYLGRMELGNLGLERVCEVHIVLVVNLQMLWLRRILSNMSEFARD